MRRTALIFFSVVLLFCGALFVFREQCVVLGTKVFLHKVLPNTFVCKEVSTKDGKVCLQGLQLKEERMELSIDRVEFSFDLSEVLSHPKRLLELYRSGFANWTQILVPMKQYGLDLTVQTGILQLDDQRYYFNFTDGEKKHEIGTLSISHDPGLMQHPFLSVQFCMRGDQLLTNLLVEEVSSERLLHLAAVAFPDRLRGFEQAQGNVQLRASVIFEEDGQVDEFSTRFSCQNFELRNPKLQLALQLEHLAGDLSYPEGIENAQLPIWKKMQCELSLEKGSVLWGRKLALSGLQGNLALDPREDPVLNLKGELLGKEKPLALQLEGRGAIHEDSAYWLEFALNLHDRLGTECGAFLSICRPEAESLVVQLEANHLLPGQVEMLKGYLARSMPRLNNWEIQQGDFGGKLVVFFEQGNLAHFEVQDLIGENVALSSGEEPLFFSKIQGHGRLFDALNFSIDLPTAQFFSFISPELKAAYSSYRPDDASQLSMTVKFEEGRVETSAHVDFLGLDQSLQFGFTSKRPLPGALQDIQDGWARSEKITHMLYGPFVRLLDEDLKVYGDVDMIATYDGEKIDFALQIDEFLSKHPLLDFKAVSIGEKAKTKGRARFTYDPVSHDFEGQLPLRSGQVYERRYGLYFQDADADFTITPKCLTAHVADANVLFDQTALLRKAQFDFSYEKVPTVTNLKAELPLLTDKEFRITVSKLDPTSLACRLFDGKEELAHFEGKHTEGWDGSLVLKALQKPLQVQFGWDPMTNFASLKATSKEIELSCKKEGTEFIVEKLSLDGMTCKGALSKAEQGFILPYFEVQKDQVAVEGSGSFLLNLPKIDQCFSIHSDLELKATATGAIPAQCVTTHPVKLAYCPDLGLVCSGLDLEGSGCHINIGQAEYCNKSGRVAANQCTFSLSDEMLATLFEAGSLPELLRDFQICKGLSGKINYSLENGQTSATGVLYSKKGDLDLSVAWKDNAGEFSLGEQEQSTKLTFQTHYNEGVFSIDSVRGSLRRLTADLKKLGKDRLKGIVTLDFSLFDQLFDLPMNHYLSLWKTGGGYQFDGIFSPKKRLSDWTFKGKVKGSSFACAGYQLRSLEAKVQIGPGQITVENLDLTDDAGKLWIGEGALTRSGDNSDWHFTFPSVEIRGFHPSFLQKIGVAEHSLSPLTIKSATLQDMHGWIDDPSSITASGSLRFTNIFEGEKKLPASLPLEALAHMGLDGSLFVPESGEVSYVIQNGRCYLQGLHSVISEKRHSEFQPPRSGVMGYLDFDGNFFIDLQVKQHVDRSHSSPLSLKLRGTWNDPQVIIR